VDKIDITFFVPCFNEEKNIIKTLENIINSVGNIKYEILVCDDGSKDNTKEIVKNYISRKKNNIILYENDKNLGIGFSYFKYALEAKGEYYMLINGDNVEPSITIKKIVDNKGKADIIIPYFGTGDCRNLNRKFISHLFTFVINLISFNSIKYYNGAVLHKTENVRLYRSKTYGYGYQAELITTLLMLDKSYLQVQVINSDREWGTSKAFSISNILSILNTILSIFINKIANLKNILKVRK
jgi:glycosyltransferase involved in cell wall biosynthesis